MAQLTMDSRARAGQAIPCYRRHTARCGKRMRTVNTPVNEEPREEYEEIDPLQLFNIGDANVDLENPLAASDFKSLEVGARDWTVQTLVAQIKSGNIQLDPRFQRRSAWSDIKRSRFVESLIVGVPIPQIVLAEIKNERGRFVVIDGKQRLLTLAGLLYPEYDFWVRRNFQELLTVRDLNGISIDTFLNGDEHKVLRRQFANQSIRAALVVGADTDDVLYDIFFRLNSGSVPLSGQELRQALLRGEFTNYLFEVTNTPQPIHRVMNIPGPDQRMYDAELVLRYLANSLALVPYAGNLKGYLDDCTRALNSDWASFSGKVYTAYGTLNHAIENLSLILEPRQIGRRRLPGRWEGRLNKALLEVEIYHFSDLTAAQVADKGERFVTALEELCADPVFRDAIELTTKSPDRFAKRFEMFGDMVSAVFAVAKRPLPRVR